MNKLDYLKFFFENKIYESKAAIQAILAIQFEDPESSGIFKEHPGAVFVENGKFNYISGTLIEIAGDVNDAFVYMDTVFDFPGDFHPMLKGNAIKSTFGLMLFNIVLFWEPFGGKVDYVNKSFANKKMMEGILSKLMVDNPAPGEEVPEGKASVDDCLKFSSNCQFLHGLSNWFVKPGGVDTLTLSPAILKRKEELLAELRESGKINDPVAFTEMLTKLVDMDRKEQLSGPSRNFYIADKYISTARKRMFLAFGIEQNATGDGWVALPRSLDEGIDPEQVVNYINTAVAGAYSRSMATGEGGSRVKDTLQLIGRSIRNGDDCGTPIGEEIILTKSTAQRWVGGFFITGKGKAEQITAENAASFIGKTLIMRVPQFCGQVDNNFCLKCLGAGLGANANRLSAELARVPTEAMLTRMKAHHQAGLDTVIIDLNAAVK